MGDLRYVSSLIAGGSAGGGLAPGDLVTELATSASNVLLGRATAGAGAVEEITCTAAGRAILDDADAAAQRATLGAAPLVVYEAPVGVVAGPLANGLKISTQIPAADGEYMFEILYCRGNGHGYIRKTFQVAFSSGAVEGGIYGDSFGTLTADPELWVGFSGGLIEIVINHGVSSGSTAQVFTRIYTNVAIAASALTGWTYSNALGGWPMVKSTEPYTLQHWIAQRIKLDDFTAPDDNTDLNATSSRHGLLPKLSNVATEFLNGTGAWSTPSSGGWTLVEKTTDETITSDSTLSDDSTLKFSVSANTKYRFRFVVFFRSPATPDFKFAITGPSSPTLLSARMTYAAAFGSVIHSRPFGQYSNLAASLTGSPSGTVDEGGFVSIEGVLHNGVNSGTVAFQWAQDTSDASSTTVLAGSYIEYKAVA